MDSRNLRLLGNTPPWDWPEDAGEIICRVLRDSQADAADRQLATELAGDTVVMNDDMADALLTLLQSNDEAEQLRGQAAIALGPALEEADTCAFDDPDEDVISQKAFDRIRKALHKVHMDAEVPKLVRRRALEASVRASEDWHEAAVREAWSSDDQQWRLTAVFCMGYIGGFDKEIVEALASEDPEMHFQAVCAASGSEVKAAWPHMVDLINTSRIDKELLLAAIAAVVNIRPKEAAEVLADLMNSKDEDVREAVDEALAMVEGIPLDDEFLD